MSKLFWLDDEAWAAIEPHLPKNQPGARRTAYENSCDNRHLGASCGDPAHRRQCQRHPCRRRSVDRHLPPRMPDRGQGL